MSKVKLLIIFASTLFLILLTLDIALTVSICKKNNKPINIAQKDVYLQDKIDSNINAKISLTRNWRTNEESVGGIYNCTLYNNTNLVISNWEVKIRVPEDVILLGFWNCNANLNNGVLKLSPEIQNNKVPSFGETSAGFIIGSDKPVEFSYLVITGQTYLRIHSLRIHTILIVVMLMIILSVCIALFIRNMMQKRINQLAEQKLKDEKLLEQTMKTFVNFIDSKDQYTRGHSVRVAEYSRVIAKQLGYDEQKQKDIYYMGLMHDIGKMTIPDDILNKTTHLSSDEWEIIKMHTTRGANLLKDFSIMESVKDAVLYHHERFDGKGYQNQLKGEDIPLSARIICVADSFDAMNTTRCYRLKYSKERIVQEIERCAGKQFDPIIAHAMIEAIKNGSIKDLEEAN